MEKYREHTCWLTASGQWGGLNLSGDILSLTQCAEGEVLQYLSGAWRCSALPDSPASQPSLPQVQYSAGDGLNLNGTTFSSTLGTSIEGGEIVDGV